MAQPIRAKNAINPTVCRVRFSGMSSIIARWGAARWQLCGLLVFLLIVISGCVTPGTRPDDMTAEAHRIAAEADQGQASEHLKRYDPDAIVTPGSRYNPYVGSNEDGSSYSDFYWDVQSYNPTERHLSASAQLERHAADHLAAAESLDNFEELACKAFPPQTRGACPLLGQIEAAKDIPGGVRFRFSEGVDVNAAVAHIHCHLAFARTTEQIGMESCPLYITGVEMTRFGSSAAVELSVGNEEDLKVLRQRVREHLVINSSE